MTSKNVNRIRRICLTSACALSVNMMSVLPAAAQPTAAPSAPACDAIDGVKARNIFINRGNDNSARRMKTQDDLVELIDKCGSYPELEYFLAQFLLERSGWPNNTAEQKAADLNEVFLSVRRVDKPKTPLPDGFYPQYADLQVALMQALVALTDQDRASIPAFVSNEPMDFCLRAAGLATQKLWQDYRESPTGHTPAYTSKLSEACAPTTKTSISSPAVYNALTLATTSKHAADAAVSRAYAVRAQAELERWFNGATKFPSGFDGRDARTVVDQFVATEDLDDMDLPALFSGRFETDIDHTILTLRIAHMAADNWDGSIRAPQNPDAFKAQARAFFDFVNALYDLAAPHGDDVINAALDGLDRFATGDYSAATEPGFMSPPDVMWKTKRPKMPNDN